MCSVDKLFSLRILLFLILLLYLLSPESVVRQKEHKRFYTKPV